MSNGTTELDLDKFVAEQVIEIPDFVSSELYERFWNQLHNLSTTVQELNGRGTSKNEGKIALPTMHPTNEIKARIEGLIAHLTVLKRSLKS